MKLSVMQENLARGLGIVSRAVSSRSTLPVLSNVLLRTEDAGLKLTATNLEIGITCWVAGKIDGCLATPFPMANAINQSRVPVLIVHQLLSFGFDGHYDDATVVRADSGIKTVADLKGKTFGVNAIGGTLDMGVRIMARKAGLNPDKDLTVVEARPPFLAGMVRDNKIQAATLFQPFFEEAMGKAGIEQVTLALANLGFAERFFAAMARDMGAPEATVRMAISAELQAQAIAAFGPVLAPGSAEAIASFMRESRRIVLRATPRAGQAAPTLAELEQVPPQQLLERMTIAIEAPPN